MALVGGAGARRDGAGQPVGHRVRAAGGVDARRRRARPGRGPRRPQPRGLRRPGGPDHRSSARPQPLSPSSAGSTTRTTCSRVASSWSPTPGGRSWPRPGRTRTCPTARSRPWSSRSPTAPTRATVAAAIDAATAAPPSTLTDDEAVQALPGHQGAELHLHRDHLRDPVRRRPGGGAVLRPAHPRAHRPLRRAEGDRGSTGQIFAGVLLQAVVVALVSFAFGGAPHAAARPACSRPRSPSHSCPPAPSRSWSASSSCPRWVPPSRCAASSASTLRRPSGSRPTIHPETEPCLPSSSPTSQDLPLGRRRGRRPRPRHPRGRRRRDRRPGGPVRLGQDHAAVDLRRAAHPDRGHGRGRRRGHLDVLGQAAHRLPARLGGLRVPGGEPGAVPHRPGEPHGGRTTSAGHGRGARRRTGPTSCSTSSVWSTGPTTFRGRCRAASASGWPSGAP